MSTDSATDLAKQASASSVGLSAGSGMCGWRIIYLEETLNRDDTCCLCCSRSGSAAPMAGSSSSAGDVDGNGTYARVSAVDLRDRVVNSDFSLIFD